MSKRKTPGFKKWLLWALVVLIIAGAVSCGSDDEHQSQSESEQQEVIIGEELVVQEESIVQEEAAAQEEPVDEQNQTITPLEKTVVDFSIPAYSGKEFTVINNNVPFFDTQNLLTESFELYADLDSLGRCGSAVANIGIDIMPTEERGEIGQIKPAGWHTVKYDNVDGGYLYNRCHLIGYQLTGENANEKNLITGTRYLNVVGMLPFENLIADYVEETENHVLYRSTPIYTEDNVLCDGILLEGFSVEDNGKDVCFCVFLHNVQPGVVIDYKTGESHAEYVVEDFEEIELTYVLNKNSKKFHEPSCSSVKKMAQKNYGEFTGTRDEAISMGYDPCKNCNP